MGSTLWRVTEDRSGWVAIDPDTLEPIPGVAVVPMPKIPPESTGRPVGSGVRFHSPAQRMVEAIDADAATNSVFVMAELARIRRHGKGGVL